MIWTWDGHEFRFITDVLGVAPLGASDGEDRISRWIMWSMSRFPVRR